MDPGPQIDLQHSSNSFDYVPRNGPRHPVCATCRDCLAKHGFKSVLPQCLLKGCHICTEIAMVDDELSATYEQLSDLLKKRHQLIEKPRYMHDTIINRMPVEILSAIFVFVRDVIFNRKFREYPDCSIPIPLYRQPSQSPPLIIGAVCKMWRDITLTTPRLWTDIIIDLAKCAEGQSTMVKKWGIRSRSLPLDITVSAQNLVLDIDRRADFVVPAVRSLAVRWNDIALYIPGSVCHKLLNNLKESPPINTLSFSNDMESQKITLQRPLRPRYLISNGLYRKQIPFEWDRLELVKMDNEDNDVVLDIIRHAPNLRHCIGGIGLPRVVPIPPGPITLNHSLTYLDTSHTNMLYHLTLPSLSYLNLLAGAVDEQAINALEEFIDRSRAPLNTFIFQCNIDSRGLFPPLGRLSGITCLCLSGYAGFTCFDDVNSPQHDLEGLNDFFLALSRPAPDGILPHLKDLSLGLIYIASWSSFCELFRKDDRRNLTQTEYPIGFRRPFSRVQVKLLSDICNIDKDTFLHLLDAKNSGANLILTIGKHKMDLFEHMAKVYDVEL